MRKIIASILILSNFLNIIYSQSLEVHINNEDEFDEKLENLTDMSNADSYTTLKFNNYVRVNNIDE